MRRRLTPREYAEARAFVAVAEARSFRQAALDLGLTPSTLGAVFLVRPARGARRWLAEHPGYLLHRVQCSIANDLSRLREQVETPEA